MKSSTVRLMGLLVVAVALCAVLRLDAQEPPQMPPPSPIEQALVERVCSAALEAAHDQCAGAKLTSLRADFGPDLGKLSVADRRSLDDACIEVRTLEGRDGYISCLDAQLARIRARMTKARPAAATAASGAARSAPVAVPDTRSAEAGGSSLMTILLGTVAGVLAAGGVGVLLLRSRREQPPSACSRCGADMPESGSLCGACRREAAEEVRRAAAQRANQERAHDDVARREREEIELREQQARFEEEERVRQQELTRQREAEEERLRQQQDEGARRPAAEAATHVVQEEQAGPWAVLGVAKDAGPDEIYAAYQQAKAKYDPDFVSHLGSDAQEHFRNKAQAIDAAYQQLMAALTSVA